MVGERVCPCEIHTAKHGIVVMYLDTVNLTGKRVCGRLVTALTGASRGQCFPSDTAPCSPGRIQTHDVCLYYRVVKLVGSQYTNNGVCTVHLKTDISQF
jgi:hypothetical protein